MEQAHGICIWNKEMISMNINSCNLCAYIKLNIYSNAKYISEPFDIKGFTLLWVGTFCTVNSGFLPQHFPPQVQVQVGVQVPKSLYQALTQSWPFSLVHRFSLPDSQSVVLLCLTCPGLLLARFTTDSRAPESLMLCQARQERKHISYTAPLLLESILQMSKAPLCFVGTGKAVCCRPRVIMMKIAPKLLGRAGAAVSCKWRCTWKIPVIPIYYTNGPW